MAKEQGVWQLWPVEVLASAPAGVDSNWMLTGAGSNFGHQSEFVPPEAQPDRARPEARMKITRRMSVPFHSEAGSRFPRFCEYAGEGRGAGGRPLGLAGIWTKFSPASDQ
jgi:hypothetical protein